MKHWPMTSLLRPRCWPNARNIQSYSVHTCLRGQVERFALVVAPGQVVWMLGSLDSSQVCACGREDPESARAGNIHVPFLIDLYAVYRVFPRCAGHVEEDLAVR